MFGLYRLYYLYAYNIHRSHNMCSVLRTAIIVNKIFWQM